MSGRREANLGVSLAKSIDGRRLQIASQVAYAVTCRGSAGLAAVVSRPAGQPDSRPIGCSAIPLLDQSANRPIANLILILIIIDCAATARGRASQ